MNLIFADDSTRANLLPLTFTRPVADLRCGILTVREKWHRMLEVEESSDLVAESYLAEKFTCNAKGDNWVVAGSVCPDAGLVEALKELPQNTALVDGNQRMLCARMDHAAIESWQTASAGTWPSPLQIWERDAEVFTINHPWELFTKNGEAIERDFELLTAGRTSAPLSDTNTHIGNRLFIEEGATVEGAILNSDKGPIYVGRNAEIMEGSVVRGPLAMCEGAVLKLSAKIYGPTTIGPHSKVGGEVNNSMIIGYSNKGHDGFLGNSVLGEWCNLGADTNNSNLKNNYAEVKLWNYPAGRFASTGLQFCGLVMGDHSKCGINTMFNTGTVVGVFCNIYGAGFPRNFVPSFAWGGAQGMMEYKVAKTFEVAERVMSRRNVPFTDADKRILEAIYEQTAGYRRF